MTARSYVRKSSLRSKGTVPSSLLCVCPPCPGPPSTPSEVHSSDTSPHRAPFIASCIGPRVPNRPTSAPLSLQQPQAAAERTWSHTSATRMPPTKGRVPAHTAGDGRRINRTGESPPHSGEGAEAVGQHGAVVGSAQPGAVGVTAHHVGGAARGRTDLWGQSIAQSHTQPPQDPHPPHSRSPRHRGAAADLPWCQGADNEPGARSLIKEAQRSWCALTLVFVNQK